MSKKFCSDDIITSDSQLSSKYLFKKKIGTGCFGKVFKVINLATKEISALKVQYSGLDSKNTNHRYNLDIQYNVLKRLKNVQGVPKILAIGNWQQGKYLEMELLQSDFSLLTNQQRQVSKEQVQKIGSKYLCLLKQIHDQGIIHRDLKPQNMMENHYGQIYMIDFGISKGYSNINKANSKKRNFVGTPRYASISAHAGYEQSPKDDIQSLFYVLAHFYFKVLPWMKLPQSPTRMDQIMKLKQQKADGMFMKLGINFYKCFKYIKQLKQDQKVNYKYLTNLLQNTKHQTFTHKSSKTRKQQKKLSLPASYTIDNNKILQHDTKYSIKTSRQVINLGKSICDSIGTIVINWVNKQSIVTNELDKIIQEANDYAIQDNQKQRFSLKNVQKSKQVYNKNRNASKSKDSKFTSLLNIQNEGDSSCFNLQEFQQNIEQNEPKIRTAQKFITSHNPFIKNA